jgi:serine/threonine protein kinase/Flp pilus assembly protein TadD
MKPSPALSAPRSGDDPALFDLVEEMAARLQSEEAAEVEVWIAAQGEYAERLRRLLPTVQVMAELGSGAGGSGARLGPEGELVSGVLGDFRIVREVGRGGMGVVYEAEQVSLKRRVALKVLPFAATMDPRHLQRFHNEARAAASLEQPHIVPVYGVGCERGVHYYAMKFIDGQSLAALIDAQRQSSQPQGAGDGGVSALPAGRGSDSTSPIAALSTQRAPRDSAVFHKIAEWGIHAAEALEHAHSVGIVHRDIKPANLMIDGHGALWVTDFGLARTAADAGLTMTGDVLGTLRYMSPEQALAQRVILDHRTDIYSLGVTLYELLTLQTAFGGEDRQELLRQIAFEEPTAPRRLNKVIPAELEIIVLKAMEKRVQDRYATAQDLADDLRRWREHRPIRARRPSWRQVATKWARRHRALVAAAVIVLLSVGLLGGSAGLWWVQKRAVAEGEARAALKEATELQQQERWPEAISAVRRAKGVLVSFRPDPELWQQLEQLDKDLEMVLQLEEARFQITSVQGGTLAITGGAGAPFDWGASGPAYAAAFERYGLDVDNMDPSEAGRRIRSRSICLQLAAALDDWAFMRRHLGDERWRHLLVVARVADPDPWRDRLRDALAGDDPRVLAELAKAATSAELPPTTAVLLSRLTYGTPAAEQAAVCLRQAWLRHPADFSVNLELSLCLFKLFLLAPGKNRGEAHRYATAAVALRPQSPGAHLQLATTFQFASQVDAAIVECQEALRLRADCPGAHRRLGILYASFEQYDRSIAAFREAIKLQHADWSVHSNLGHSLYVMGQLDDAIKEFQQAIKLDNKVPLPHCMLGNALKAKALLPEANAESREGFLKQAIKEYQTSILLNKAQAEDRTLVLPNAVAAHRNLGDALRFTNRLDEAIAEYNKAIKLPVLLGYQGFLFGEASDELSEAMRLGKGEDTVICIIADAVANALNAKGLGTEVYGMYASITLLTQSLAEAYSSLGAALHAKGQRDRALAALRQGTRLTKETARMQYKLGKFDMADGRTQVAWINYRKTALFYEEAFAADPRPADEPRAQHRFTAACAAVMAASLPGTDTARFYASKRREWRRLALNWLRADLAAWDRALQKEPERARRLIAQQMQHWLADTDFASVRSPETLAKLPAAERQAWKQLWADVADTLTRAEGKTIPAEKPDSK